MSNALPFAVASRRYPCFVESPGQVFPSSDLKPDVVTERAAKLEQAPARERPQEVRRGALAPRGESIHHT